MKKILLQNSSVSNFKKGKKSTSLSFLIHNALAIVDRDSLWQATERPRHQGTVQKYKKKYIFTILLVFILSVTALAQDAFITTWVVGDNTYGDGDLTVTIPTTGRGYNYTVDWGDGTIENNQTGNAEHTYTNAGEKTIKIYGDFPRIYFDNAGDKDKITAVTHWGDIQWQSMVNAFWGCSKLDVTASDAPNLQNVTNLYGMFAVASMLLGNETFNNWDVGKVENMINMFWNASSFNADIGSWNVGNVENMANMFRGASSFQGVNIGTWGSKTSKVTNMSYMFEGASAFNADISGWDVGEVTNMESMFYGAANFNNGGQPMNWGVKTGKVTDMNWMFYGASSFNADISGWDVGEVTNMYAMFYGATNFNNGGQPMNWDAKTGKVTNMVGMFLYASSFDADISGWDVGEVTTMHQMFAGASSFNADISGWDVGEVTTMEEMFYGATNFNNGGQPMNWDAKTGKVTDMSWMFYEAENFDQDIGDWDVGEVTTMEAMFYGATNFNNGGEPMNWDAKTGKVTDMSWMFFGAEKFNADISGWDVGEVTNMGAMFYGATNFNNGGQPMNWDAKTGKVTNMGFMFNGASAFNADISGWDVGEVTNMESMFQLATNFNNGGQPMNWDAKTGKVTDMSWMFYEAENFDQDIGDWDVINVTNMGYMFTGVKLSVANYDALLIGWNSKVLQNNVPFSGGLSQYCLGESARSNMMNNDNWTITDAGKFGPTVDDIANQTVPNSYTLPTITGANLSGNQRYYTGSNGTGTVYDSGDSIGFGDFTSYPITLYIYDGVGLSCDSEEDFQLTITSVPPPCTLLSLPLAGETNVGLATDFQWNPVSGATGYRLTVGTTSMGNDILDDVDVGNVLDYDLPDDLPTNSSIHVHITPYNLDGDAIGCTEESFTTEPVPPPCTSLSLPLAGETNVGLATDLQWNPVSGATGYRLTVGTTSMGNDILDDVDVGNVLDYDLLDDLPTNSSIHVHITPYNLDGDAIGCTEEFFTTESAPPPCTLLSLPLAGETNVGVATDLLWNPVSGATGYRLTVGTTSMGNDILDDVDVGNVLDYDLLDDLPTNSSIHVHITPYNLDGDAIGCTEEFFTTEPVPPPCTSLSLPLVGETNVGLATDLQWNPVSGATGYRLTVGTTSMGNDILDDVDVGNVLDYDLPDDLPTNSSIHVHITPYNLDGDAIGCTEESFTTESAPPPCTSLSLPLAGETNVGLATDLQWNPVSGATGYRLTVGTTSMGNDILDDVDVGNVLDYDLLDDLPTNSSIHVHITPYNLDGDAIGCTEEFFTTEPVPPPCTSLSLPLVGETNVGLATDLQWNPVSGATGYRLTVGTTSMGNDILDDVDVGNVLDYDLPDDLPTNSSIHVHITPYNLDGDAIGCTEESFTTESAPPPCTSLSLPLAGETNVGLATDLQWNPVSGATGYRLTVGTTSMGNDILDDVDVGNVLDYDLLDDLPTNSSIHVHITPYNLDGDAIGCTEESFTTEPVPPPCTSLSLPLAGETNVGVATDLQWNPVSGATGYRLTVGTTSMGNDILDDVDVGNVLDYDLLDDLPTNSSIHVHITPYNLDGGAIGCAEEFFTTETIISNTDLPPRFFTPNSDNINDRWIIPNSSNQIETVFVFDQYGKFLKQIIDISEGWDGTFKGSPLPANDYWYLVSYRDGKTLKGHFSLIR